MIEVCMASNEKWTPLVAVTIASIMENTKSKVNIYVLETDICNKTKEKINKLTKKYPLCNIEFIKIDIKTWLKDFVPNVDYISLDAFSRFIFPVLKPNIKKVIYTDIDVAFNKDIKELYETDLNGNTIGAVTALFNEHANGIDNKRLGISQEHRYFQSGLLIIDCPKWRNENILEKLIDASDKNKEKLRYGDQDLLNIVFDNNYLPIDPKWCFIFWQDDLFKKIGIGTKPGLKEPAIYHYCGGEKPWFNKCKYSEIFWKYAKKSLFYFDLKKLYYNKILKLLFENIFSIKNKGNHKIISLLGFKIKLKRNNHKENNVVPIFMIVSDDIADKATVAIVSILENTKENIKIYFLEKDTLKISDKNIKNIKKIKKKYKNFSFEIITMNSKDFEIFKTSKEKYIPIDTYFRYYIPVLDKNIDKAIYIDYDVIILDDIKNLYNFDLNGNIYSAVRNEKGKYMTPEMKEIITKCKLKDIYTYFNNGVAIFDCKKCRENNITEKLVKVTLERGNELDYADQDVCNIVFEDCNIELPQEFNTYAHRINKTKLPKIIHYVGPNKPWLKICPYQKYFWQYAKKTPYYSKLRKIYEKNVYNNNFFENIFSLKNKGNKKILTILGLKIKIKRKGK